MNLTLEVISANGSALGAGRRKVFGPEGGRIGRSPECDWTLPSPNKFISRHQATILCQNGQFYVKAEGGSGVSVNEPGPSIPFGSPRLLKSGDRCISTNTRSSRASRRSRRKPRAAWARTRLDRARRVRP